MELHKSEPSGGLAFVSHIYFGFAVDYSDTAANNPTDEKNLDPRLLASILFSYFSLEALIHEFMAWNSLIPDDPKQREKEMKCPLTDKIRRIIGPSLASREPYNSAKILEKLRHSLVHYSEPAMDFINWTEDGIQKRAAVETKLDRELKNRFCIPKDTNVAISIFRPITIEGTRWACDTVFLMARQIEKVANNEGKKGLFQIYALDSKCAFVTYNIRSKYFKRKPEIVRHLCRS